LEDAIRFPVENLRGLGLSEIPVIIQYNTYIENRNGILIDDTLISSSTLFCNNSGRDLSLPFNSPQLISLELDGNKTREILSEFYCNRIETHGERPVYEIKPQEALFVGTFLIVKVEPTRSSYPLSFFAFLTFYVGLLTLGREILTYFRKGLKHFLKL
jgi:hypothetical protein